MVELKGLQGNEIADDFKKTESEGGRWRRTWEVFKTNFWKLVALNLLVLVAFIPAIVVIYMRNLYLDALSAMYPFNASIGYPFYPHEALAGLSEQLVLWVDIRFYALLIAAGLIASAGISGAAYCIRKLLHTKNKFNIKGLLHGIKVGYLKTAAPVTLFMLFLYCTFLAGDWMRLAAAQNGGFAGAVTLFVFAVIFTVLAGIYLLWLFALGVSYRTNYLNIVRNAFKLMFCTPIQTVFMAGFSLIPVWLVMIFSGFWLILVYIIFALFGFTFVLISWLSFSQWACGLYLEPDAKTEKSAAPQKTERELAAEAEDEKRREALALLAAGKSSLISRPIKPISDEKVEILGKTFTRAQIEKAGANREKIGSDVLVYQKAHENEKEYVEYNKMFEEREKALVVDGKGKKNKAKKVSAENLLK